MNWQICEERRIDVWQWRRITVSIVHLCGGNSQREPELWLRVVYRGYYTAGQRYEFYFQVVNTIFYEPAQKVSKLILVLTRKIKFISSSYCVIFLLLYRQICRSPFLTDCLHKWPWKSGWKSPLGSRVLPVVYFPVKHSCLYNKYILINGFAYNMHRYFASCVVLKIVVKCEQWAKCPRVLYAKPSIKRFIITLQKYFFILASFFLVRVLRYSRHYLSTRK